jgi:hypothetical protein
MSTDPGSFQPAENGAAKPLPNDTCMRPVESPEPSKTQASTPPDDLQQTVFLSRLQRLRKMHNELDAAQSDPPMWGLMQGAFFVLAVVCAWGVRHAILEGQPKEGQPQAGLLKEGQPKEGQPKESQPKAGQPKEGQPKEAQGQPKEAPENEDGAQETADIMFVITFFLVLAMPYLFLYLSRRMRKKIALQELEENILLTARTYPAEVEHSGGLAVLADRVELEALVQILEERYRPEAHSEK